MTCISNRGGGGGGGEYSVLGIINETDPKVKYLKQ